VSAASYTIGTLFLSSGATVVAAINIVAAYTSANAHSCRYVEYVL
jgi:hypothetical protein